MRTSGSCSSTWVYGLVMRNRSSLEIGSHRVVSDDTAVLRALGGVADCAGCGAAVLIERNEDGAVSEFARNVPEVCPNCGMEIAEDTLVRTSGDFEISTTDGSVESFAARSRDHWYEEGTTLLITEEQLLEAQAFIAGCIRCAPKAGLPFIYILDELTESDPATTTYVLCRPAHCPGCDGPVSENTLVVGCGWTEAV